MLVTSNELFMAILSMDAYTRVYNVGIEGIGGLSSEIGQAILTNQSDVGELPDDSCRRLYAIAYDFDGQTVISYRGTDDLPGLGSPAVS